MDRRSSMGGVAMLLACAGVAAAEPLKLPALFTDHMVLQRNRPIAISGLGPPGATISVRYGGHAVDASAQPDGRWVATLPAIASFQGDLEVVDSTGGSLRRTDVVTGDVFLCSGQSNMDLAVSDTSYPRRTAEEGEGEPVRILKIRRTSLATPARDLTADIGWAPAGPDSLPGFSAACWHMARNLVAAGVDAPIGLIQASWGGASIEDWIPPAALENLADYGDKTRLLAAYGQDPAAATAQVAAATDAWASTIDRSASASSRPDHDDSNWPTITLPGAWERSGVASLRSYDGIVWFRRTLTLTSDQAGRSAILKLGQIDERDQVWVNGRVVGATVLAGEPRAYVLPPGALVSGRNVIAVRVVDERGSGGFLGRRGDLALALADAPSVDLSGEWRFRTAGSRLDWKTTPPFVAWSAPRGVSTMWNGMIAPLQGFPLKGVAWYQGESNVSEADAYRGLIRVWAQSWRAFFGDLKLPIVIAQLPSYGPKAARPSDGEWPRLREAQRLAAVDDPQMGLAVLIDLGVSYDIHPAHKEKVGERLANEMLRLAYARKVLSAPSPVVAEHTPEGVRVRFTDTGGGLVAYGSSGATAFELCDGQNVCEFAPAKVEGDSVILPRAPTSFMVRYAWQGSPPVNLYGGSGLPVAPFSLSIHPAAR
ncbi:sialate O-acetylesterase [Caulobacter segnis]|uniref:Sialate O-acetylesterase domain-containing protein n=1 Tax=Caulobacter segnis TaxID=88688 RepID=A0A2W5VBX8_9CAUL|nr:sialate O-acetylesterase [Caulobacter segnis]PZR32845.1 MAG: hypothetical protein DI526_15405 [Caulobacter segnis]